MAFATHWIILRTSQPALSIIETVMTIIHVCRQRQCEAGCVGWPALLAVSFFVMPATVEAQISPAGITENLCLIETSCETLAEAHLCAEFIAQQGGRTGVIVSPQYMVGWLDPSLRQNLVGKGQIVGIRDGQAIASSLREARAPMVEGALKRYFSKAGRQDANEVIAQREPPPWGETSCIVNLDEDVSPDRQEAVPRNGLPRPAADPCIERDNSERMVGTIACALFFVESDGSQHPDLYTWTEEAKENVLSIAMSSVLAWSFEAGWRNIELTSTLVTYDEPAVVNQPYEPITTRGTADAPLWIGAIMDNLGIEPVEIFDRIDLFNKSLKETAGTDWAFSTFVAYNPVDEGAPESFSGGVAGLRYAWAVLGGPFMHLSYDNLLNYPLTFAHEMGHIFHAFDEYGGPHGCQVSFNGVRNTNYRGAPCFGRADCIMVSVIPSVFLCAYTAAHIGWERIAGTPSLVAPSAGATVASEEPVVFSWERNEGDSQVLSFLSIVDDASGEPIYCEHDSRFFELSGISPTSSERELMLPPGLYSWYVTNGGGYTNWAGIRSKTGHFVVADDLPRVTTLHQNYPNPFNPRTTIRYYLETPGRVLVTMYNIRGEQILTLHDQVKSTGSHEFIFSAGGLASGIYYYKLESGGHDILKKMLLIK